MIDIGRICVKIAGRDAGKECIVIENIDSNFVMIDGNTRRKKCNIKHLQLLPKIIKIKERAGHEEVKSAMESAGIKISEKKVSKLVKKEGSKPVKTKPAKDKKEKAKK